VRARFGPFVVDLDTRQLIRENVQIHLTPKAYQLLTLLVEASPRALSKDELQQGLWPSTFVDEANLSVLIAELRSALGDEVRHSRYIRTVHGFGYAFAANVERVGARSSSPVARSTWWLVLDDDQVQLDSGESIVGRDPAAHVRLDSASVSRRHARLVVEADGLWLEDLGSKNGTWRNEERVTAKAELSNGDEVRFGSLRTRVRRAWSAGSTETIGPV
jgi:DNA-binding winged helix-turn-helix (wHTH) protein